MVKSKRRKHPWKPTPPTAPSDTTKLDEFGRLVAEFEALELALHWRLADLALDLLHDLKALGFGQYAAAALIGEAAGKQRHWAMLLAKVAVTFPEPSRIPSLNMQVYKVALRSHDPWRAIEHAAKEGLNSTQLRAWIDKNEPETKRVRSTETRVVGRMRQKRGDIIIRPSDDDTELGDGDVEVVITKKTRVR